MLNFGKDKNKSLFDPTQTVPIFRLRDISKIYQMGEVQVQALKRVTCIIHEQKNKFKKNSKATAIFFLCLNKQVKMPNK